MRGGEMESQPIVVALKREKSLLERVLYLALHELDMLKAGRVDDVEKLLLLRAEPMGELAMAEANVEEKMPGIESDLTIDSRDLAELHDLNVQITRLADCIIAIDEQARLLVELGRSSVAAKA
jgi:hypothetical protein